MSHDENALFKVFRALWFPMSVNAVALGAATVVVFQAWTLLLVALAGSPVGGSADVALAPVAHFCSAEFPMSLFRWISSGHWPTEILTGIHRGTFVAVPRYGFVFALQLVGAYGLWTIVSVAMARIMAVRIARDEYLSLRSALGFAWRNRNTALLHAPALVLPIAFLAACVFVVGLAGQIPWIGWLFNVAALPITIFFTILVWILSVAGTLTLGLTPSAIAAERRGTYDALGKAFNYLFARPFAVLLYLALLTAFLWFIDRAIFDTDRLPDRIATLESPFWSNPDFDAIARGRPEGLSGMAWFCAALHKAVFWLMGALVSGAYLSFVSGGCTAMFLILRQEIDGVGCDDVVKDGTPTPAPSAVEPEPPSVTPAS